MKRNVIVFTIIAISLIAVTIGGSYAYINTISHVKTSSIVKAYGVLKYDCGNGVYVDNQNECTKTTQTTKTENYTYACSGYTAGSL